MDKCNPEALAASGSQAALSTEGIKEYNEDVDMPVVTCDSQFAGNIDD